MRDADGRRVVRRNDKRRSLGVGHLREQIEDDVGGCHVELARRLIGDQQLGTVRESGRDGDALKFAM